MAQRILATLVTTTSYGTWVPGDARGYIVDGRLLPPNPRYVEHAWSLMSKSPVFFTANQPTNPRQSRGLMGFGVRERGGVIVLGMAAIVLFAASAQAFDRPVDTAGPLTVRIEGPEEVTRLETPAPVRVVLENKGDSVVKGMVELKLVDRWRADPADPVPFSVDGKGSTALDFRILAGKGTYNAHYPVHILVRFEAGGQSLVAHPILILQAKISAGDGAEQRQRFGGSGAGMAGGEEVVAWQPFPVGGNRRLALWQLPVYRVVVAVFGEVPLISPVGWRGSELRSRGSLGIGPITLDGKVREAIVIHPPWYEGHAGTQLIEFPLQLPDTKPIALQFSNGMQPEGKSDGVTFRVRVAPQDAPAGQFGEVVFERHLADKTWRPAEADLSRFAGQVVRVQLESHPGPDKNLGWDNSYWGEPTLVAGTPQEPLPFPPAGDEGSQVLGTIQRGDQQYEVRIWPGRRGLLDSTIGFLAGEKRLFFHGFKIRVLGSQLEDARTPVVLEQAVEELVSTGRQMRHRIGSVLGTFDLVGRLWVDEGVLRAKFALENVRPPRPWLFVHLEDVAAGPWSQVARQIYAGDGNVIRRPETFQLNFDGHFLSTSFVGLDFENGFSMVQGTNAPPTHFSVHPQERHYSIHTASDCTFSFIPTQNVWEGARAWHDANGLTPAAGVKTAAGRFVFDLWGGQYAASAEALRRSFRYGLTDAMVVWHNWQRWGYDYRLPEICPPNPRFGTIDEMRRLIAGCKEASVPFALHDNYIDFYPDADGFSYEKTVAFSGEGQPARGWLNEGRGAQAYRYRADCIERFLRPNLEWIRENLGPTAYFIDVWSSAGPYDYWTPDGQYFTNLHTRKVWRDQFAWIRDQLGGTAPQISESGHDQLIGYLDGAQTNHLRVDKPRPGSYGWSVWSMPCEDAERTPWFDAAHHDRFILHGAGYSSRYEGGLEGRLHGIYSDDYMTTEVLTGHPAMVANPFGRDVVRKYWLTSAVMRRLALERIEGVEYVENDLHRQHVRWSGGGEVWANRGQTDWSVAGSVLPPCGFLVRAASEQGAAEAAICRRDGVITESASSPDELYVNGRQVVGGPWQIRPAVDKVEYLGDRDLRMNPQAKPIDFGAVTTCGACRFSRDGKNLVVTSLPQPDGPAFSVAIRWSGLPWKLPEPTHVQAVDEEGKVLSSKGVERNGDAITLVCEPGVFQYRLVRQ